MVASLWFVSACLAVGGAIGFSGGVVGIGGGLIAIPLLGLVLGYPQQAAQGTALVMVLPAVLLTVRKYHQRSPIDWRSAAAGAAGSVFFSACALVSSHDRVGSWLRHPTVVTNV